MAQTGSSIDQPWERALDRLAGAYSPCTLRAYRSDMRIFASWCEDQGVAAVPATVGTLCRFLEAEAKSKAAKTVRRRLTAIQRLHVMMDFPDPTRDVEVEVVMRRVTRQHASAQKQAKGLTLDHLERFMAVQPDTPTGLRNRAMLSLGYDMLARRAELVALLTEDVEFQADGTMRVLIRRAKEDQFGMGRIAATSRRSGELVRAWLAWRGPDIRPLFCPIESDRPIGRSLSTTAVRRLVKAAAHASGFDADVADAFSSHSMRVGAAQDLLKAGHDLSAIMRAGGWKSVGKLMRYLDFAEHNVWTAPQNASQVHHSAYAIKPGRFVRRD